MNDLIEVNTADLIGPALDHAVAIAEGMYIHTPNGMKYEYWYANGRCVCSRAGWAPSTGWSQGGPLIDKHKVLISPPTSPVHRNFGYMDKRNGYAEAGVWGSTIFGKDRKHRRAAFHHPDSPLIVAMLAIVQSVLGDTVQVPKELMP